MRIFLIVLLAVSLQFCTSCDGESDTNVSNYTPIFMSRADFESAVAIEAKSLIEKAGKIYTYQNYLFINEQNKGFHIFDNSDISNPIAIAFINTPGATDMAIKSDVIYINQATDLIAVQLNDALSEITVSKRIKGIFPQILSPDGFQGYSPSGNIVVDWVEKNITE